MADNTSDQPAPERLRTRSDVLEGRTYKLQWPSLQAALYVTINNDEQGPHEIFINSKDARDQGWTTALTLMITAAFRRGGDISFIPRELQQVVAPFDHHFKDQRHYSSLPAYLGTIIERHMKEFKTRQGTAQLFVDQLVGQKVTLMVKTGTSHAETVLATCPDCRQPTLRREEGCSKCSTCGYNSCS